MELARKSDIHDVSVVVLKVSERACLCLGSARDDEPQWFPLSQVELADNGDGTLTLSAPEWLLVEKGFM
jgi:hypothetical protein